MSPKLPFHLIVTAGPTREMLDPVRYISNMSTGQMGYALARLAKQFGFRVTLISGPTALPKPQGVRFFSVMDAHEMKQAISKAWSGADALIMSAAVCDYQPVRYSVKKIKRSGQKTLQLKQTPDILGFFGTKKGDRVLIGFALETERLEQNAIRKLQKKNLDLIVANRYGKGKCPFGKGFFSFVLIDSNGVKINLNKVSKDRASALILKRVLDILSEKSVNQARN